MRPVRSLSRSSSAVMMKPEMMKKTSNPEEPARGPPDGVIRDDGEHCDGAQTLDVAAEVARFASAAHTGLCARRALCFLR